MGTSCVNLERFQPQVAPRALKQFGVFAKIFPVPANGHPNNGHDPGTCSEIQVLFREPMSFPNGTILYKTTTGPLVAVLPDNSLIVDGGGVGGSMFKSAFEYRKLIGDRENWDQVRHL